MDSQEIAAKLKEIDLLVGAARVSLTNAVNALAALREALAAQEGQASQKAGEMRRWEDGSRLLAVQYEQL
ncbi:MAG: hypothetical protein IMX02_01690 [Limnochordaceae bacterium]|nr:hypothetical protein [Limnochordaceae bacterium]